MFINNLLKTLVQIANKMGLQKTTFATIKNMAMVRIDRLCGLVVRVLGYRSGGPGSIPSTIRKK
jgi:hypothetical protein